MKLHFLGAARTVTGSMHLIEVNGKKILLDCGLFQGCRGDECQINLNFPFDPSTIDVLILSHAHIDHSGNIPNLVKNGFKGSIYCTNATKDLCQYMLRDSGYIQEREAEYLNQKKAKRKEVADVKPMYTEEDAIRSMLQFQAVSYHITFRVTDGVEVTFLDAGHILGSAITVLNIDDRDTGEKIVLTFTGDLGRKYLPILRDPELPEYSDILITESTYGNKLHDDIRNAKEKVAEIVNSTINKGGKIIIPAFAVGRIQEVIYTLHELINEKRIPQIPIFVDSPLAINVTDVFKKHTECYDAETATMLLHDDFDIFGFNLLTYVNKAEDSMKLNDKRGPMIIISASGMCEHGRILHHLKNSIEDPKNTVMIVGYQAESTLGRKLVEGMKIVNIFGKPYKVKAKIEVTNFFSAHADKNGLIAFATGIKGIKKVFIVHGDEIRADALKSELINKGIPEVYAPSRDEIFDIDIKSTTYHVDIKVNLPVQQTDKVA